ncbi:HAD family hydrolase [Neisseria dumasiana]|uniref:phosphoglycolate phosphatase n=1 Tax=Neisseria dumasiana TaxID=1931275 RepID=A0A1X3DKA8_9NEIS|nr:HAD family hydrolase [Neisseria dumasiana]OSI24213.1 phosphoglycolate phosphatase [Neisseria dumasiana]
MTEAVLFDLDGTLADTALDLGGALNTLLRRHNLPEKSMEEVRPVASHGASGLILMGAGITKDHPEHARWRQEYLAEYERCFDHETVLFDGIDRLIAELDKRGIKWGIITNKPHTFTHRLVPKLGFSIPPAVVVSGDTCGEAKPSTKPMFYACEQIGVKPANCIYVGDAERDMQAGKNAGMKTVVANWGYIAAEDKTEEWLHDARIDTPLELLAHL